LKVISHVFSFSTGRNCAGRPKEEKSQKGRKNNSVRYPGMYS